MAAERLQVILELITGQYKKEAHEAATSTKAIGAAAEKTGTEVKNMEKTTEKAGQSLSDFGKLAVAAIAVKAAGAVKAFVDDSVRAFSDLEQATGGVEAVFGESAEGIEEWARSAAKNLGMAESAAKNSAVVIGSMLQNYGFSVEDSATKTMELITLGSDLSAMFGGTVPDAVSAVGATLRGEFDTVEKFGISLSAAKIATHAVEMGLADTTAEIEGQDKALATLDLITQQTSKASGQFAREQDTVAGKVAIANAVIENQKVVLGEALVPLKELGTEGATWFSQMAAQFGIAVQHITGNISNAEAAVADFEAINLKQLDTGEELAELWAKEGGELKEFLGIIQFSTEELQRMAGASDGVLLSMGLSRTEIAEWREEVGRAILSEAIMSEGARQLAIHQGEVAEETVEATNALTAQFDALRAQTDPLFALIQKTKEAAESQKAMNDAAAEFGTNSPEYTTAALQLVEDNQAMIGAQIAFAEQSGMTRDEFETNLREMGITSQTVIDAVLAEFDRVNAYVFTKKDVMVNINGRWVGGVKPTGMPDEVWKNIRGFASGGIVPGPIGNPQLAVVHGGEMIVPPNSAFSQMPMPTSESHAINRLANLIAGRGGDKNLGITVNYPNHTDNDIMAGIQRAVGLAGLVHFAEVTSGES